MSFISSEPEFATGELLNPNDYQLKQDLPIGTINKLNSFSKQSEQLLNSISREDIRLVYTFVKKLGSGSFGSVRTAYKSVNPSKHFAVKSIKRDFIETGKVNEDELIQELLILRSIDHPNIVKLHEIYLDHDYLHFVQELCLGGPICPSRTPEGKFSERDAAKIVRQSLQALNYLHELNIVHRDLKTENILLGKKRKTNHVKLIDFGFAKFCRNKTQEQLSQVLGTPYYMSPEVLRGKYDKRCDLWAIGVLSYVLLSGRQPFFGTEEIDLDTKILTNDYDFPKAHWSQISNNAIKFIERLIEPNL